MAESFNVGQANNFKGACAVFADIEGKAQDWAESLAALGIVGEDVAPYVTEYVAQDRVRSPRTISATRSATQPMRSASLLRNQSTSPVCRTA